MVNRPVSADHKEAVVFQGSLRSVNARLSSMNQGVTKTEVNDKVNVSEIMQTTNEFMKMA